MGRQIRPVILCGGSGTRLWPLSTPKKPKQFLCLTSQNTMIRETQARFETSVVDGLSFSQTLVIGSQRHAKVLRQTLKNADLVLEPYGRNSAPAVAAACLCSAPDDILLILPADHSIKDVSAFQHAIATALEPALAGNIVTFGVEPTFPSTGYGYIQSRPTQGIVRDVLQFVEKPELETAEAYLATGEYFWNAGIFMFTAKTMLAALDTYAPVVLPAVRKSLSDPVDGIVSLSSDTFKTAPDISIDYAVMEHVKNVKTVPVSMGWSDVGDYQALWQISPKDRSGNVLHGAVHAEDTEGLFVRSEGPTVAVAGVKDLTVVATPQTVMVISRHDPAAAKLLGAALRSGPAPLSVSEDTRAHAKSWLWNSFDVWKDRAWDAEGGGFVEQLTMDGVPDRDADRRVRVQARQTYSFAKAITLGWPNKDAASDLVHKGLDFLDDHARHPDGGWAHVLNPDGSIKDDRRDLYDHAFIILACAGAFEATSSDKAHRMAYEALDFIDENMYDVRHGGWVEALPVPTSPRRANPHMHLLEASLALYGATNDARALEVAHKVVLLFEKRFFDPAENVLREYFSPDWSYLNSDQGRLWEPGHMYEWATLLKLYDDIVDRNTLSWRLRMINKADQDGRDHASGFAHNSVLISGDLADQNRRIWPQLEMFRARMFHPESAAPNTADMEYKMLMDTYMSHMPDGMWLDQTDQNGASISKAIPASILYHAVTALAPLI